MAVTQEYFAGNNSTHTIHFSQENFLSQMIPKVIVCESKMVARSQLQKESLSMLSEIWIQVVNQFTYAYLGVPIAL